MKHYHGGPFTPKEIAEIVWDDRCAFVSFAWRQQIEIAARRGRGVGLDNGAFSFWKAKKPTDWPAYYAWCEQWLSHENVDWAVIPDVIDGDESANDSLIKHWPFKQRGVPVWHLHESLDRLLRLCWEWPRVALGSSGQYATIGNHRWWIRMSEAMHTVCDKDGKPITKLHGLRMLDPKIFTRLPLSSADSTNVAMNFWRGQVNTRKEKKVNAIRIANRIESFRPSAYWAFQGKQENLQYA